jgi:hypothetical protein
MNEAVVIGNGPSRLSIDLEELHALMTTYGCNALYRDFIPNYLISMDYSMVDEILKARIHYQTEFYTQHSNRVDEFERKGEPIKFFWGTKETQDSGNSALRLALDNQHDIVYMIGFDYSSNQSFLPNVYLGTPNYAGTYANPSANAMDVKWGNRLRRILKDFPEQKVVRVNGSKSLQIDLPNYSEITIEEFKELINARIFV